MNQDFLHEIETLIAIADEYPKEEKLCKIQLEENDIIISRNNGKYSYEEFKLLYQFATMIENSIREELRKQ